MNRFVKWGLIIILIICFIGVGSYFIYKNIIGQRQEKISQEPTKKQKEIMDTDFLKEEDIKPEDLDSETEIYNMIHEMANTKIVAEDGMIWGLKPITKSRVAAVIKALEEQGINDAKLNKIMERWSVEDFRDCVDDHNYVWGKYLDGNIGKAVKLREK